MSMNRNEERSLIGAAPAPVNSQTLQIKTSVGLKANVADSGSSASPFLSRAWRNRAVSGGALGAAPKHSEHERDHMFFFL